MTAPFDPKKVSNPQEPTEKKPKKPEKDEKWLGRTVVVVAVVAVAVATLYCFYEVFCYMKDIAADRFSKETNEQLEDQVKKKGLGHLVHKVKQIKSINQRRVLRCLSKCKEHEVTIFKNLEERFTFTVDHFKEMMMGAHIRLNDAGNTYNEWAKLAQVQPRISSHPSSGQQFAIRGMVIKELLFSSIHDKEKKHYTWFQLENNPVSFGSVFRHMLDYVAYKISSENQGPYGSSAITDLKPLLIELRP